MVIFLLCVIVVCLLCIPVVRRGVGKLCGILLALVLVIGVIGVIGSALSPAKHQEIYTTDKQPAPKFDAVDGAHSAASTCHRVVASKRTT
jgi:hypothetical protein